MIRKRIILAFLAFGLVACGDDGMGPEDVAGTYTLETIDGNPLPWVTFETGADKIEITGGSVTLNADMTCSVSTTARVTFSGNVTTNTETHVCTYTIIDGDITLTRPSATDASASINGSALTITTDELVFVYRK